MKNQRINRGIIDNENASKANTPGYEPGKCCLYPLLCLSMVQSIILSTRMFGWRKRVFYFHGTLKQKIKLDKW